MPSLPSNAVDEQVTSSVSLDEAMKANEKYLHDFFVKHQKTILENTIQEYRVMFIYDNIPLLLGYVCLFVLGLVANGVQIYATILQIRRRENTVCSKMFLQLAISQTLLIVYLIPMDYLWRYSQVWEAGERACQLLVWIRFYLIVTVAAFTVLQTFVRYRVMRASAEVVENNSNKSAAPQEQATTSSDNASSVLLPPEASSESGITPSRNEKDDNIRSRNRPAANGHYLFSSSNRHNHEVFATVANNNNIVDSELADPQTEQPKQILLKRWLKSLGNSLAGIFWPTRRLLSASLTTSSSSTTSSSAALSPSELWRRVDAKRNFNENRLILLGWLLPLILCAPEAAVYKLHVHKDIGGYQQCADIFVKQEELLFPRLFPSSGVEEGDLGGDSQLYNNVDHEFLPAGNNDTAIAALIFDINNGSGDDQHNSFLSSGIASSSEFETITSGDQSDLTTTLLAGDIDLASISQSDAAMTPVQIVYYLLLQSLTFVIPVGAILIINALVVKCYWQIRRRNNNNTAAEQCANNNNNNSNNDNAVASSSSQEPRLQSSTETDSDKAEIEKQNGKTLMAKSIAIRSKDTPLLLQQQKELQLRELRNWAAHRTLFLTLSFGVSYIVCWFPMAMLMATRWNALFLKPPPPDSTPINNDYDVTEQLIDGDNSAFLHSSLDTDIGQDYSSLGFWAFIEEWAIAWGLMIGVINPLLYGLFHLLGGNHKKLYDLQLCAGLVKTNISTPRRTTAADKEANDSNNGTNNKARLQQLFSSCRQNTDQNNTRRGQQPFRKTSTSSRNVTCRYSHYGGGQQRLGVPKTIRPSGCAGDQCQISHRKNKNNHHRNRSVDEVLANTRDSSNNSTLTTVDEN